MRTWQVREFGIDSLSLADAPDPAAGPGQVILRTRAWSLNYRDLMVVKGEYNPKMQVPAVPLSDCAGEVVECGPGVTRVKAGDRVMGCFMPKWISGEPDEAAMRSALGAGGPAGVASEYVLFDEHAVVPIPEYLDYEEAATLPCAGVTAWHALVTEGETQPEDWVLIQGTGGVAVFALQIAKLLGARALVISSSDDKIERVRAMGADATVNYSAEPAWEKAAREITGGRGVDAVVEIGGSGTLARSMRAVRPGGRIYVIGVLAGRGEIAFTPVFMRNLRLQGIFVGSRDMFEDLCRGFAGGGVRPVIHETFAFTDLPAALRSMERGGHLGKICLRA
jgi:NADPH:quinone reductase-like Zn-dependent oxidoreductase